MDDKPGIIKGSYGCTAQYVDGLLAQLNHARRWSAAWKQAAKGWKHAAFEVGDISDQRSEELARATRKLRKQKRRRKQAEAELAKPMNQNIRVANEAAVYWNNKYIEADNQRIKAEDDINTWRWELNATVKRAESAERQLAEARARIDRLIEAGDALEEWVDPNSANGYVASYEWRAACAEPSQAEE